MFLVLIYHKIIYLGQLHKVGHEFMYMYIVHKQMFWLGLYYIDYSIALMVLFVNVSICPAKMAEIFLKQKCKAAGILLFNLNILTSFC